MNFNYLEISRDIFSKIFLREIRDAYVLKIANLSSNSNSQRLWLPIVQVICHEKWPPLIIFFLLPQQFATGSGVAKSLDGLGAIPK